MDLYLLFHAVRCFPHRKKNSLELNLGSKPKSKHETSPDLFDREMGEGLVFTSKVHCKYGFTKTGEGV
jgi:hypothetical protein